MAQYEHLPVFRKSFQLAVYLEQIVSGFGKKHKYGLGSRLLESAQKVFCRVIRAQNSEGVERISELKELRLESEVLKNLLNLANEVKAFKSSNAYRHASEIAVEISRQVEGWLKSSMSRMPESRSTNPKGGRS